MGRKPSPSVSARRTLRRDDYITSTHRGMVTASPRVAGSHVRGAAGQAAGYCRGKGGSMHIADQEI
ncbi:MAG: hypothetical protein U0521_04475 [Anaerolineae bacterium]